MTRTVVMLLAVLLLLCAAQAGWCFIANDAATGYVDAPAVGSPPGTYTSTWTVEALPGWEAGWLMVELEFQPDGQMTAGSVDGSTTPWSVPLTWSGQDGWIGWYLPQTAYASQGLASSQVAGKAWVGTYTTIGDINPMNYHIRFAKYNESSGKWVTNQLSKNATPGEIPEPGSLALLAMGLTAGVGVIRRRRAH